MPESLGKTLKKIRESKLLSIEEASDKTRIPKKIISAIEEDNLSEVSSSAFYAHRFMKAYSQFLGATEEKAVKEYLSGSDKKDTPQLVLKGEKVPGDWFLKYRKYIGITIIAFFGIYMLGLGFIQVKKLASYVSERHRARVSEKAEAKARAPKPKPKPPAPSTISETDGVRLEILAHSNTWIQVVGDGEILFRGVLRKRAKDVWQAEKKINLELGDAGGVTMKLNGKDIGSPGKRGEKKVIVVTKDGIK